MIALLLAALLLAPPQQDDDLLPPPPKVDVAAQERLQHALETRRTMLATHQVLGFVNLATLTTAVVLGQLNYTDKYGGGGDKGTWHTAHKIAGYGAFGVFAATGLVALLAPSPTSKPTRLDTATLHKVSMGIATAGMIAQVALGIFTAHREGVVAQRDLALAHQITGYVTLGATATGFAVLFF